MGLGMIVIAVGMTLVFTSGVWVGSDGVLDRDDLPRMLLTLIGLALGAAGGILVIQYLLDLIG